MLLPTGLLSHATLAWELPWFLPIMPLNVRFPFCHPFQISITNFRQPSRADWTFNFSEEQLHGHILPSTQVFHRSLRRSRSRSRTSHGDSGLDGCIRRIIFGDGATTSPVGIVARTDHCSEGNFYRFLVLARRLVCSRLNMTPNVRGTEQQQSLVDAVGHRLTKGGPEFEFPAQ